MSADPVRSDLARLREEYTHTGLQKGDVTPAPVEQFRRWFSEAQDVGVREPNAVVLATCGEDRQPSSRVVLLKGFGDAGFDFFTNYESRKGRELAENPRGSLTFFWADLERQVNVRGGISRLPEEESETYFRIRPYGSRIGAWVSEQSCEIPDRDWIENREQELLEKFPDSGDPDAVPLPTFWGGYRLVPEAVEFWQGRPNRLHDRIEYREDGAGEWTTRRLSP